MSDRLFVYGTLREEGAEPAILRNFYKREDGPYPTIEPCEGETVEGQIVEVDDWSRKDRYEGCRPLDMERSLYWRLDMSDGTQVYVGNPEEASRCWGEEHAWDAGYDLDMVKLALAGSAPEVTA